jgi:transcriptional regulator with XRE-family HTH domain
LPTFPRSATFLGKREGCQPKKRLATCTVPEPSLHQFVVEFYFNLAIMKLELGEIIKKMRELKGLTQSELASKSKISLNTINRYENDYKDRIPLAKLEAIAKVLNTSVSIIYQYKENPTLLSDPGQYLKKSKSKPKISLIVELDGTHETLNGWVQTLKRLNSDL